MQGTCFPSITTFLRSQFWGPREEHSFLDFKFSECSLGGFNHNPQGPSWFLLSEAQNHNGQPLMADSNLCAKTYTQRLLLNHLARVLIPYCLILLISMVSFSFCKSWLNYIWFARSNSGPLWFKPFSCSLVQITLLTNYQTPKHILWCRAEQCCSQTISVPVNRLEMHCPPWCIGRNNLIHATGMRGLPLL